MKKQTENQVGALKSLDLSSKKGNLKQIECTFAQDLMNDLIRVKLKQIVEMQNVIKKR